MDSVDERWYCIACQSKAEESVVQQLVRRDDVGVFLAKMPAMVGKGSRSRIAWIPMFPGYVFVRMRLETSLVSVRYTPGIRDIVRFGGRTPVVPEEVIEELKEISAKPAEPVNRRKLEGGMLALVETGPFEGFTGTILRLDSAAERVQLLIELLGGSRILEVERAAVRPTE